MNEFSTKSVAIAALACALVACQAAPPASPGAPADASPSPGATAPRQPITSPGSPTLSAAPTDASPSQAPPSATPAIDPSSLPAAGILARTTLGPQPSSLAWVGEHLWVADEFGVSRLDPSSGEVLTSASIGPLASVAAQGDVLLFASYANDTLALADAITGEAWMETEVPCPRGMLVIDETAAWVASPCVSQVAHVSIGRGVTQAFEISDPHSMALGEGAVWVAGDRRVIRIDTETNELTATPLPRNGYPTAVAYGETGGGQSVLWVTAIEELGTGVVGTLLTIDPVTLAVARVDEGNQALRFPLESLALVAGEPWVVGVPQGGNWFETPRVLSHVDPSSNTVTEEYAVPAGTVLLGHSPERHQLWLASPREVITVEPAGGEGNPQPQQAGAIGGLTIATTSYAGNMPVDIYHAAAAAKDVPVYVFVGGGPVPPSERHHMSPLASALADRGAVVMVIGYRSGATGDTTADALADTGCAVAFARQNAPDFGGDAGNINLVGFSYGGEVVVQAAAGGATIAPDCAATGDGLPDGAVALAGFPFGVNEVKIPRLLLVSGTEDRNFQQGRSLSERLRERGFEAPFVELPGIDHAGAIDPAGPVGVVDLLVEFAGED